MCMHTLCVTDDDDDDDDACSPHRNLAWSDSLT